MKFTSNKKRVIAARFDWPILCMGLGGLLLLCNDPSAAAAASFDEIEYWVGEGPHRAALVIDWSEQPATAQTLVWGYRFADGDTGADMLRATLSADERFFAKISASSNLGLSVYGLGYDWNGDALFELTDGTSFDAMGVADAPPADGATSSDPFDAYAEGWFTAGYWSYATALANSFSNESEWVGSAIGAASRTLADGAWDAWTFAPSFAPAFPDDPTPAPISSIAGDFDRDLDVDGADLLLLQRSHGMPANPFGAGADGDRSGSVGDGDLAVWLQHFGAASTASLQAPRSSAVPEPAADCVCWAAVLAMILLHVKRSSAGNAALLAARNGFSEFCFNEGDCS